MIRRRPLSCLTLVQNRSLQAEIEGLRSYIGRWRAIPRRELARRRQKEGKTIVQVGSLSINSSSIFRAPSLPNSSPDTKPSVPPKASLAGPSSSPCCSANWGVPMRCVKSATVWDAVWGDWCIWGLPRHLAALPCLTPMSTGQRYSWRICSGVRRRGFATSKHWWP